ncbi:MAG TPA: serine hydrolase domain-containing protein [Holophagaceae bacterium]|nr:serine hydrolase domain-containing protein [Holophagaceae bacterium]
MKPSASALLAGLPVLCLGAAPQNPFQLQESTAQAFVAAFNAGEDAMAAFWKANATADPNQQRSMEERLASYRRLRSQLGDLKVHSVDRSGPKAVALLVQGKDGSWVSLGFAFDAAGRVEQIRITEGEDPHPGPPLSQAQFIAEVESYLKAQTQRDAFSGSVLIARNGEPIFQRAFGMANRELGVPNTVDTRFNLGSINKIFTKVAIGQLAAAGKLSFDDPVGKYLPDYPNAEARAKVKIRHLLDMSAGIGDFFGPEFEAANKERIRSLKDYLPFFASKPLGFEPGTDRQYSNGGYVLLGLIVEKAAGQDYYAYVKAHVYEPCGMKDTDWLEVDAVAPNVAEGYIREGGLRRNVYTRPAKGSSAGGGYATTADMLRFAVALRAGKLLPPGLNAWVMSGSPTPADAKASAPARAELPGLGIGGGAPGINAALEMDGPITAVVLCNEDPPVAQRTARHLRALWRRLAPGGKD